MAASEGWIIDEETLTQASTEAVAVIEAMQGYVGLALTDEQRQVLRDIEARNRQRISLMDGVKSAMGALLADGYPEPIDTADLAPFQAMLEAAHAAEGEKLEAMASHIDKSHEPEGPDMPPRAPMAEPPHTPYSPPMSTDRYSDPSPSKED